MKKSIITLTCLLAVLALALPASAASRGVAGDAPSFADPADGWAVRAPGVWQRDLGAGRTQLQALGDDGLRAALGDLRMRLIVLVGEYVDHPDERLLNVIDTQLRIIYDIEAGLERNQGLRHVTGGLQALAEAAASCTTSWDASTSTSGCKNKAVADSSYTGTSTAACFGGCYIYTSAYASRTVQACAGGATYTDSESCSAGPTINISCHSEAETGQVAPQSCFSSAFADIYCPDISWYRSDSASSSSCGGICLQCAEPNSDK